ncbi:MAG: DNA repair protein RecN [Firmicutes bacterium]|nr:DNA repair protein RecN [Bacillota bacterium]
MLERLSINNIALIEKEEIEFGKGLNILSGETGAGKSMIIDSLNFVLGERTGRDIVRKGQDKAWVEAVFSFNDRTVLKQLQDMDIESEDGTVVIKRVLTSEGKSSSRINGSNVTAAMLKQLSESFIDIHGQHEHQSLLNPARHMDLLDKFCGAPLENLKAEMAEIIKKYKNILSGIEELSGDDDERAQKIEMLMFRIGEIDDAALTVGEEEVLAERKQVLNNAEKIKKYTNECLKLLYYGGEKGQGAMDSIGECVKSMGSVSNIDTSAGEIYDMICDVEAQLDETVKSLKSYAENISSNEREIEEIEERLDLIYHLKRKYGNTVEDILKYREKCQSELDFIINSEEALKRLKEEKAVLFARIKDICDGMDKIRVSTAAVIEEKIETQLKDLEMKNARFKISVTKKDTFNSKGCNVVEFLITPNAGEDLKPLAKIASGGEMSRVMLALKTVIANADCIETFIFDEIDTGVSGITAQKVAEKMALISKERQILCITHLPQIAAMADNHFLIEKTVNDGKTVSGVRQLNVDGSIDEIARLIGGEKTELVEMTAEEMKMKAEKYKDML